MCYVGGGKVLISIGKLEGADGGGGCIGHCVGV